MRKSAPLPHRGGTKPAGFQAIAASPSSTAMKAPPIAIGRGDTVLTLPTGSAGTGSTSTTATASVMAVGIVAARLLRLVSLIEAQYITAQSSQQAMLGAF